MPVVHPLPSRQRRAGRRHPLHRRLRRGQRPPRACLHPHPRGRRAVWPAPRNARRLRRQHHRLHARLPLLPLPHPAARRGAPQREQALPGARAAHPRPGCQARAAAEAHARRALRPAQLHVWYALGLQASKLHLLPTCMVHMRASGGPAACAHVSHRRSCMPPPTGKQR